MSILVAFVLVWVLLRLAQASPRPRRGSSPARELYQRRLRDAGGR